MNNFGSAASSPQRKKSKKSVNFTGGGSGSNIYNETPFDQAKGQYSDARSPKKANFEDGSNNRASIANNQSPSPNNQTLLANNQTPFANDGLIKVQPVQGNSEKDGDKRKQTAGKGGNSGTFLESSSLKPNENEALTNYSKICKRNNFIFLYLKIHFRSEEVYIQPQEQPSGLKRTATKSS
jgi:hypothetical protein